jgi:vitamin B12 transporter
MSQFRKTITFSFIAALSSPALAQNNDAGSVVITATRTAETYDETLASVTVIGREEIENSQATTFDELLTGYTGVDITQRGGYGKNSSIFMRGTKTGHVLFLVDGVKLGSATLGLTSFQHIPLEHIERIEIVRGPRSSLYGSEAIGGVIQVFTRKGTDSYRTRIEAGAGSHDLQEASISTSGRAGTTGYSLSLAHVQTDGIDALEGFEDDEDGYRNMSGALSIQHQFANGLDIQANFLHAEGDTEYDGAFQNNSNIVQQVSSVKLSKMVNDNWLMSLTGGTSRDEDEAYLNAEPASEFITKHREISWQNDWMINQDNTLTLGADHETDDIGKSTDYTQRERDNTGVFLQHQADLGDHNLVASLRNDDNGSFGAHTTGSIAWGYQITEKTNIFTNYGTAFKAPTFGDLYSPWGGNPDLQPEESSSIEVGIRTRYDWGKVEMNVYQTEIDEMITWVCNLNCDNADFWDDIWQPLNIDEAEITGAELQINTQILGWQSRLEMSWVNPIDQSTDKVLLLRAKRTAKLDFQRQFGPGSIGLAVLAQSSRYADQENTEELGGYGIANLRGAWLLSKHWQLKGKIGNIGDKSYETSPHYNSLDRTYFVGIAYDTK